MNPVDTTLTLSQLVTGRPDVAPVLEVLGLDYCCGGTRSLAEACADAGLDVDEVVTRLSEESPAEAPAEWASLGPAELVDHIEHVHHTYLGHALPRLSELLSRVIDAHAERHPELHDVQATFEELRRDLEPHLAKEEEILFPMIRELQATRGGSTFHAGSLQAPIGVMRLEHDRAGELLALLRAQTSSFTPPADGCPSYQALYTGLAELEADTHLHIHKENNLLFPAVVS